MWHDSINERTATGPWTSGATLWTSPMNVPFRFTGAIDNLNYGLASEQRSAEDKRTVAETAAAKD